MDRRHERLFWRRKVFMKVVKHGCYFGLENSQRVFKKNKKHINYPEAIYNGEIIVMPKKDLNTQRLSGVNNKGTWIYKSKLLESKYKVKYPKKI